MKSLLDISNHKDVLVSLIDRYKNFELTEDSIKKTHRDLMSSEISWEVDYKPHLVGNYRNIPAIGFREPYFPNKKYVPHYNIEFVMATYIDMFNAKFEKVDNSKDETHLIASIAFFHNIFLNKIHPFADGNGRVCRILMGTILMKNNCPPIFAKITSDQDRLDYINKIIDCEKEQSDKPLVEFLANGMSEYLEVKVEIES